MEATTYARARWVSEAEFHAFCRHYEPLLERHLVRSWRLDRQDAREVTQDVLDALARRWSSFADAEHRVRALWVVARNKAVDFGRCVRDGGVALDHHADLAADATTCDPAVIVCRGEEPLWQAVRALPAARREAVLGRIVHRMSYEDLAAETGRSTTALRQDVSRGLRLLRHALAVPRSVAAAV